jgi:hypothetical protein
MTLYGNDPTAPGVGVGSGHILISTTPKFALDSEVEPI